MFAMRIGRQSLSKSLMQTFVNTLFRTTNRVPANCSPCLSPLVGTMNTPKVPRSPSMPSSLWHTARIPLWAHWNEMTNALSLNFAQEHNFRTSAIGPGLPGPNLSSSWIILTPLFPAAMSQTLMDPVDVHKSQVTASPKQLFRATEKFISTLSSGGVYPPTLAYVPVTWSLE